MHVLCHPGSPQTEAEALSLGLLCGAFSVFLPRSQWYMVYYCSGHKLFPVFLPSSDVVSFFCSLHQLGCDFTCTSRAPGFAAVLSCRRDTGAESRRHFFVPSSSCCSPLPSLHHMAGGFLSSLSFLCLSCE